MASINFPDTPINGQQFFSADKGWFWDAASEVWRSIAPESGSGSITVSEVAPENPGTGDLWFKSSNATTYIYYDGFWVEQSEARAGASGVVAATAPIIYNAETQTIGVDETSVITTATQSLTNKTLISSRLSGTTSIEQVLEDITVSATAATATIKYDVLTNNAITFYTSNTAGNWTLNIRGDGDTTLNSIMSIGQALTIAFVVTNGSTAYYQAGLQIDGSAITPKWQGGTAPTAGNASSLDSYSITIIKTADSTFNVLESLVKFA